MQRRASSLVEPISPVDPSPPRRTIRETPGTEFFSAVYLDSPVGTKPLRVRKRSVRIAGIGRAARRRRSTMSLPRTPRSPSSPCSPTRPQRTNTTSSSASKIHHSISQIFLATSPLTMSPPPVPPKRHVPSDSMASEFHLGLGRGSYDDSAVPGPSPPTSPALSPITRAFARKALPPTPMTPSRAPPKAAKLLGATSEPVKGKKVAKKNHYRPLPTQTLVEIDKFLGNVAPIPLKPSKKLAPVEKVGEGATVRHRGDDGMMWMDVAEEMEFAWLLSDAGTVPSPLPEVDQNWGMETFTSVLAMPRPRAVDDVTSTVPRRTPNVDLDISPWSDTLVIPPARDTSRPRLIRTDTSDSDTSSSSSGRKRKAQPPPLKLKPRQVYPRLPVVSQTPETKSTKAVNPFFHDNRGFAIVLDSPIQNKGQTPQTPFVRPRRAPVPNAPLPTKASRPAPLVIRPPEPPRLIPYVAARTPRRDAYDGHLPYSPDVPEEVSFFDPVTPTAPRHSHERVLTGSGAVVKGGGAWLKKMVSSRKAPGVRI